jgi:hypothetical protein
MASSAARSLVRPLDLYVLTRNGYKLAQIAQVDIEKKRQPCWLALKCAGFTSHKQG